jgi:hypothetical protein
MAAYSADEVRDVIFDKACDVRTIIRRPEPRKLDSIGRQALALMRYKLGGKSDRHSISDLPKPSWQNYYSIADLAAYMEVEPLTLLGSMLYSEDNRARFHIFLGLEPVRDTEGQHVVRYHVEVCGKHDKLPTTWDKSGRLTSLYYPVQHLQQLQPHIDQIHKFVDTLATWHKEDSQPAGNRAPDTPTGMHQPSAPSAETPPAKKSTDEDPKSHGTPASSGGAAVKPHALSLEDLLAPSLVIAPAKRPRPDDSSPAGKADKTTSGKATKKAKQKRQHKKLTTGSEEPESRAHQKGTKGTKKSTKQDKKQDKKAVRDEGTEQAPKGTRSSKSKTEETAPPAAENQIVLSQPGKRRRMGEPTAAAPLSSTGSPATTTLAKSASVVASGSSSSHSSALVPLSSAPPPPATTAGIQATASGDQVEEEHAALQKEYVRVHETLGGLVEHFRQATTAIQAANSLSVTGLNAVKAVITQNAKLRGVAAARAALLLKKGKAFAAQDEELQATKEQYQKQVHLTKAAERDRDEVTEKLRAAERDRDILAEKLRQALAVIESMQTADAAEEAPPSQGSASSSTSVVLDSALKELVDLAASANKTEEPPEEASPAPDSDAPPIPSPSTASAEENNEHDSKDAGNEEGK